MCGSWLNVRACSDTLPLLVRLGKQCGWPDCSAYAAERAELMVKLSRTCSCADVDEVLEGSPTNPMCADKLLSLLLGGRPVDVMATDDEFATRLLEKVDMHVRNIY